VTSEDKIRAAFEKWYGSSPERNDKYPVQYLNVFTQARWEAWQAAIAAYEGALKQQLDQLTRERESIKIGDIVKVIGKYSVDFAECELEVVGIHKDRNQKITYTTRFANEGDTDGWSEDDLELKSKLTQNKSALAVDDKEDTSCK